MSSPLISCICVAKNGLKLPIHCFKQQDYPNLELIIVHESSGWVSKHELHPGDDPAQYAEVIDDDRIHLVYVPISPGKRTLGELHNIGIEAARGEYCIVWDDDDWYHPERVSKQFLAAQSFLNKCVVLSRWFMYDFLTKTAYMSQDRQWEGSLLAPRKLLQRHKHQAMNAGHDTKLLTTLSENEGGVGKMDAPHLYIHAFHESNTMGRAHGEALMQWGGRLSDLIAEEFAARFKEAEESELPLHKQESEEAEIVEAEEIVTEGDGLSTIVGQNPEAVQEEEELSLDAT